MLGRWGPSPLKVAWKGRNAIGTFLLLLALLNWLMLLYLLLLLHALPPRLRTILLRKVILLLDAL